MLSDEWLLRKVQRKILVMDGQMDKAKTVYPPLFQSGGITTKNDIQMSMIMMSHCIF